jgi:hypothetical protein
MMIIFIIIIISTMLYSVLSLHWCDFFFFLYYFFFFLLRRQQYGESIVEFNRYDDEEEFINHAQHATHWKGRMEWWKFLDSVEKRKIRNNKLKQHKEEETNERIFLYHHASTKKSFRYAKKGVSKLYVRPGSWERPAHYPSEGYRFRGVVIILLAVACS